MDFRLRLWGETVNPHTDGKNGKVTDDERMNRQDAEDAKIGKKKNGLRVIVLNLCIISSLFFSFLSWRPWRLGGLFSIHEMICLRRAM
jgi:hypothetical protein